MIEFLKMLYCGLTTVEPLVLVCSPTNALSLPFKLMYTVVEDLALPDELAQSCHALPYGGSMIAKSVLACQASHPSHGPKPPAYSHRHDHNRPKLCFYHSFMQATAFQNVL